MWSGHSRPPKNAAKPAQQQRLIPGTAFNTPKPSRFRLSWPKRISHGPRKLRVGAVSLVDNHTADHRKLEQNTARKIIWTSTHSFQGWTCSQCDWNYPIPTFLNDPEARTAYDRLAAAKFRDHKCSEHSSRQGSPDDADSFTPRIRKLVAQGFKPKDAVELFLQEVALEYRNQPKVLAQAKLDAEDFLRRVRAGLI